jgi:hypothetical protein
LKICLAGVPRPLAFQITNPDDRSSEARGGADP